AAIASLGSLAALRSLNLYHTLIRDEGVAELSGRLPDCRIIWDRDSTLPNRRAGEAELENGSMRLVIGILLCGLVGATAFAGPVAGDELESWVESLGGSVGRDDDGRIASVNLAGAWVTDIDLERLESVPT